MFLLQLWDIIMQACITSSLRDMNQIIIIDSNIYIVLVFRTVDRGRQGALPPPSKLNAPPIYVELGLFLLPNSC